MEEMGMTNKQFNGLLRLLISDVKDAQSLLSECNSEKLAAKLADMEDTLQRMIED